MHVCVSLVNNGQTICQNLMKFDIQQGFFSLKRSYNFVALSNTISRELKIVIFQVISYTEKRYFIFMNIFRKFHQITIELHLISF